MIIPNGLEAQLRTELELSRIERCRRPAVVTAIRRPLFERIDVSKEWRRRRLVNAVKEVEALRDQVDPRPLAETDRTRDPQVERLERMRDAKVARQVTG